jgi:hypothetical protein
VTNEKELATAVVTTIREVEDEFPRESNLPNGPLSGTACASSLVQVVTPDTNTLGDLIHIRQALFAETFGHWMKVHH